jgi:hypothetical protein
MKERGILFSPPMVLPVMAGVKTETRRLLTPQPDFAASSAGRGNHPAMGGQPHWVFYSGLNTYAIKLPVAVGDTLWVRERYWQRGDWIEDPTQLTKGGKPKWHFRPESDEITFEAPDEYCCARHRADPHNIHWYQRLGRFMPRRYSRTTLIVRNVRVERLQSISEEDAIAEGAVSYRHFNHPYPAVTVWHHGQNLGDSPGFVSAIASYRHLWNSLNDQPGTRWADNPWIVAISFARLIEP